MSRASNLAGFITAISPTTDLSVGVLTATTFDLGGTISFESIAATDNISVGGTAVGITTINGTGINQPLGINTLGQTEFKGAVEFNDNLSSVTVADVTTINSDGVQSTGIGTFKNLVVNGGSDAPNILKLTGADTTTELLEIGIDPGYVKFTATYQSGGAGTGGFIFRTRGGVSGTNEKLRIVPDGKIGIGSTAPTVSVDISEKTDAVALPVGTTAQRPSTAYGGYIRWNSTSSALEVYNGTNWVEIISDYFPSGSTTLG